MNNPNSALIIHSNVTNTNTHTQKTVNKPYIYLSFLFIYAVAQRKKSEVRLFPFLCIRMNAVS